MMKKSIFKFITKKVKIYIQNPDLNMTIILVAFLAAYVIVAIFGK